MPTVLEQRRVLDSDRKLTALRRQHDYRSHLSKTGVTKEQVMDICKKYNVKFINMQFTDLLGVSKAVTIPIHKLDDAIDHNVWFDGSSIEGFTRIFESDMYLKPDLDTFAVLPWTKDGTDITARIICDVYLSDGSPFEGDPRYVLKKQMEEAKKLGYIYNTGPELEFFLFHRNGHKLKPLPHDEAGYFDQTTDLAAEVRRDMSFALDEMGVEVEALHHEVAQGQHEIDFVYSNALRTADNATTLKLVLKAVANLHDLHATFMPKPIYGINGSGMHVHQSFFNFEGKNVFYDSKGKPYYLSDIALSFIAGQLHHIRAMNAIINPLINSYKRLIVGYEAPVYVAWGSRNRSALIRIPHYSVGKESGARCELRCPDPACNPYLAFAVMLAAGLDGIKKKMKPPIPVEENIFEFTDEQAKKRGITWVSENLYVALQELQKNELIRGVLGEHVFQSYYQAKMVDWDEFRTCVTEWELDKYLEVY